MYIQILTGTVCQDETAFKADLCNSVVKQTELELAFKLTLHALRISREEHLDG